MPQSNLIETGRHVVSSDMCDQMGHLTTRVYTALFDEASYELIKACGYQVDAEQGFVDLELNMKFIAEIKEGGKFYIKSGIVKLGNSSFTAIHYMYNTDDDSLISICEEKAVIFDLKKRKSKPMTEEFRKMASEFLVD